jgi:alcohol dehydrogenase YqhD (iron-dependent ADH family)
MHPFVYMKTIRTVFGKGRLSELPNELSKLGKSPLLIYGGKSLQASGSLEIIRQLMKNFSVHEYNGVVGEPNMDMLSKGYEIGKSGKVDCVVSVGGGSVLDLSKAIALCLGSGIPPSEIFNTKIKRKPLPILTIPTIPGSSSEVNGGAVIEDDGGKKEIGGIFPVVAILDPEISCTVPASLMYAGVSDAMVHVAEHYFNSKDFSKLLCCWAEGMFNGLLCVAEEYSEHPDDMDVVGELLLATSLSPKLCPVAGNGPAVWEIHPLAYILVEFYDIPHRIVIGICFCAWLAAKNESKREKFSRFEEKVLRGSVSSALSEWHSSWLHEKELPASLGDLKLSRGKQGELLVEALRERQRSFSASEFKIFVDVLFNGVRVSR